MWGVGWGGVGGMGTVALEEGELVDIAWTIYLGQQQKRMAEL